MVVFLDLRQQGLSACILNLARHNLLKISQLMKLHDLSYPVLRKDVQRHASLTNLQKHLDVGKHLVKLERESTLDSVKKKWAEMCKEVSGATQKEKQLPTRKHLGMIPPARSPADGH